MGSIHQLSKGLDILIFQSLNCLDGALVLIDRMLCTAAIRLILDGGLEFFELLLCQFSETLDSTYGLQICKSLCTLVPAVIICRSDKAVLYLSRLVEEKNRSPVANDKLYRDARRLWQAVREGTADSVDGTEPEAKAEPEAREKASAPAKKAAPVKKKSGFSRWFS